MKMIPVPHFFLLVGIFVVGGDVVDMGLVVD